MNIYNNIAIEVHLVDYCNLNCVGCYHCSPLATKDSYIYNIEQFKIDIEKLAMTLPTDLIIIRLMGGEPLLHEDFLEFCRISKKYFSKVDVVTNGILLINKSREFYDEINSLGIRIIWSKYFESDKIENCVKRFSSYEVQDKTMMNNTQYDFTISSNALNQVIYDRCTMHSHSLQLRDGYIYKCPLALYSDIYLFSYFNIDKPSTYNIEEDRISIDKIT